MHADERQRDIVERLHRLSRVEVSELAQRYDVTVETIRRDLAHLDRAGVLRKVHGGAVPVSTLALPETGVLERERTNAPAKRAIAARALGALALTPGTTLLIDAGTTTGALARLLPTGTPLTIITSSVLTASALAGQDRLAVRVLGGQVRGLTQAAVGPEALEALALLRADIAVMGTNGISIQHGLSTPDPDEAAVKRAMIRAARRVVVLADSSKIGQEHLVSFAPLSAVHQLVTEAPPPAPLTNHLADTGTEVLVA
ncbi:DeoR/GlpR family DNA-binding transcription regulator [Actinomyces oricola]|uniref:DeoR/GlpR family DNA-binding transcription regulator n=1 Tax=Actinomyces oricola TaxID=206043 RepID=UPI000FFE72BC|nr:DeoR/GlpR family DNA-binding transcription regulator [Actinomyces oricola]